MASKIRRFAAMPLPVTIIDTTGGFACAITSPAPAVTVTQGTPVTITGVLTGPAIVVQVKLGAALLGSASIVGLTWSYTWTPQVGDVGAQTINATATSPSGTQAVATGVPVTVSSSGGTNYASILTTAFSLWQTDYGLTYGVTPKATGTSPPVATLGGTLTKDNAVPLWFKCTTGGAIGSGAVFAAYVDGTGTTPIMTGITPTAGTPIAITGSAALSGMTIAWAAGTASTDNVWKATCAGLNDQTANGKNAVQALVTKQPIMTIGLNGKCGLLGDGIDDFLQSSVGSLLTFPYQILIVGRAVSSKPAANALVGSGSSNNEGIIFEGTAGNWSEFNQTLATNTTAFAAFTNQRWAAKFSGSTADSLRIGSLSTTGGNAGGSTPVQDANRQIFANQGGQCANAEIFAVAYIPGAASYSAFDTALNTAGGYGAASIGV